MWLVLNNSSIGLIESWQSAARMIRATLEAEFFIQEEKSFSGSPALTVASTYGAMMITSTDPAGHGASCELSPSGWTDRSVFGVIAAGYLSNLRSGQVTGSG